MTFEEARRAWSIRGALHRKCRVCRETTPVQEFRSNSGLCTPCAQRLRQGGTSTPVIPVVVQRRGGDPDPAFDDLRIALDNMREIEYNGRDEANGPAPDPQLRPARVPAVRRGPRPTRPHPPGDG